MKRDNNKSDIDSVIEMAWCDKTSFESIKAQTGLAEKDVIKIMRSNLKKTSFKVWRERVYGRKAKHYKIYNADRVVKN
ncbi:TIGR03643 family protein [Alphaproteobacteria bacterium]|nr:TIGR03643 family protein [Alphaproteobacteria bacterium]